MKPKTIKITYWTLTILFSILMLIDGFAGFAITEDGTKAMQQLQYPNYIMQIVGTGKILGALALLQNKFKILKEWAFAGFTINFVGAALSWRLAGGPVSYSIFPLVALAVMFGVYSLWKKYERTQHYQQPVLTA